MTHTQWETEVIWEVGESLYEKVLLELRSEGGKTVIQPESEIRSGEDC